MYTDKGTTTMADDVLVGQGDVVVSGFDTLYSVNHLGGFGPAERLYFELNVPGYNVSPDNAFVNNSVPAPTTPGDQQTDLHVKKDNATGINDQEYSGKLKLYPNPTRDGSINVDLGEKEARYIRIFNSSGKLIEYHTNGARGVQHYQEELAGGMYFLSVEYVDGTRSMAKFIVQ
jgi:hypothetical protein